MATAAARQPVVDVGVDVLAARRRMQQLTRNLRRLRAPSGVFLDWWDRTVQPKLDEYARLRLAVGGYWAEDEADAKLKARRWLRRERPDLDAAYWQTEALPARPRQHPAPVMLVSTPPRVSVRARPRERRAQRRRAASRAGPDSDSDGEGPHVDHWRRGRAP
jgi:hypothetical protein